MANPGSPRSRRDFLRLGCALPFGLHAGRARATPSAAPGGVVTPPSVPPGYRLVFADEFDHADVTRINENATGGRPGAPAWRSRYRHPRKDVINKEKQIYMDVAFGGTGGRSLGVQPFRIADGVLEITAERADPTRVQPLIWGHAYTSGCISSELTHAQRYGYVEVRAKMPAGRGFWPAFWMLPTSGQWPPELDIVEVSGAKPTSVWNNVITPKKEPGRDTPAPAAAPSAPPAAGPTGRWIDGVADVTRGFHVYAMEWTPERITFFLDGVATSEKTDHGVHDEMYFLANLALGSHDPNWIPDPDETTPFPGVLSIDYVRFYARG